MEGKEGCVCWQQKVHCTLTGLTCCKCAGSFCCEAYACAFPCQKDIPCRCTICCCTVLGVDGVGCFKIVNHRKALDGGAGGFGAQMGGGMPPVAEQMER